MASNPAGSPSMLTGKQLGQAIEAARLLKGVTKKAMADHFGVRPPSIQDWVNRGTIEKDKLPGLWEYFADVVQPSHWGLTGEAAELATALGRGGERRITLLQAMEVMASALAQPMPQTLRDEIAEAMSAWARYRGRSVYQAALYELLTEHIKQRAA